MHQFLKIVVARYQFRGTPNLSRCSIKKAREKMIRSYGFIGRTANTFIISEWFLFIFSWPDNLDNRLVKKPKLPSHPILQLY